MGLTVKIPSPDERKWRELQRKLKELGGVRAVRVGVLEGAKNEEGQSIAEYAAVNEFGGNGIPARPFMRPTAREKGKEWGQLFAQVTRGKLASDQTVAKRALMAVGRVAAADIQAKIMSNVPPPNNPAYAKSKQKKGGGYSGTLFLSGDMHKSINFELVTGTGESAK